MLLFELYYNEIDNRYDIKTEFYTFYGLDKWSMRQVVEYLLKRSKTQ